MAEQDLHVGSHLDIPGNMVAGSIAQRPTLLQTFSARGHRHMATNAKPPLRYDAIAMTLHWSIAVLIVINVSLALFFNHFNFGDRDTNQAAYLWHMSSGMCVLVLSVLRVVWRLMHKYPSLPH